MPQRVDHIDLTVPDLAEALKYFRALGFVLPEVLPASGPVAISLPGDRVTFDIREDRNATTTTLHHVALRTDDHEADLALIDEAGITVSKAATLNPASGRIISNFVDPFGALWQLTD